MAGARLRQYGYPYGVIGGAVGLLWHYPAVLAAAGIATAISKAMEANTNTDSFMGAIVLCWLPTIVLSFLLGMAGGALGLRLQGAQQGQPGVAGAKTARLTAPATLLAIGGGLLGPLLVLAPFTAMVLQEWRSY